MINRRYLIKTASFLALSAPGWLGPMISAVADEDLTLQLSWFVNSAAAGEIVALERGYFKEAGLNVTIVPGGPTANVIQDVVGGQADVAVGYAPQIMYAASNGLPIKSFAAAFQRAPLTFYSFADKNITSIKDWKGLRIGVAQSAIPQLKAILQHNNMAFEDIVFVQSLTEGLLLDQVDVVAGWPTNIGQVEPITSHERGYNTQSIWDNGLQFQSNYYIANTQLIEDKPEILVSFLQAVDRGWAYVADNREEATDILLETAPALDGEQTLKSLDITIADFIYNSDTRENGFGYISEGGWLQTLEVYKSLGEIRDDLTVDAVFTNAVLEAAETTKR